MVLVYFICKSLKGGSCATSRLILNTFLTQWVTKSRWRTLVQLSGCFCFLLQGSFPRPGTSPLPLCLCDFSPGSLASSAAINCLEVLVWTVVCCPVTNWQLFQDVTPLLHPGRAGIDCSLSATLSEGSVVKWMDDENLAPK